jgi:hypothetical protein
MFCLVGSSYWLCVCKHGCMAVWLYSLCSWVVIQLIQYLFYYTNVFIIHFTIPIYFL